MKGFKKYFKEDDDVEKTLQRIPKSHRDLVDGYKFLFEPHNTLKDDPGHVGLIRNHPQKEIIIASPWRHPREYTMLHEVAHLVYEKYIRGTKLEKEWEKIVKSTRNKKKDETAEELLCHAYANHYSEHKLVIHHHATWTKFIKNLPK
jgi:hypothetical protein